MSARFALAMLLARAARAYEVSPKVPLIGNDLDPDQLPNPTNPEYAEKLVNSAILGLGVSLIAFFAYLSYIFAPCCARCVDGDEEAKQKKLDRMSARRSRRMSICVHAPESSLAHCS